MTRLARPAYVCFGIPDAALEVHVRASVGFALIVTPSIAAPFGESDGARLAEEVAFPLVAKE